MFFSYTSEEGPSGSTSAPAAGDKGYGSRGTKAIDFTESTKLREGAKTSGPVKRFSSARGAPEADGSKDGCESVGSITHTDWSGMPGTREGSTASSSIAEDSVQGLVNGASRGLMRSQGRVQGAAMGRGQAVGMATNASIHHLKATQLRARKAAWIDEIGVMTSADLTCVDR